MIDYTGIAVGLCILAALIALKVFVKVDESEQDPPHLW